MAPGGIVVEHARRAFGSVLAVDDISLTARPARVRSPAGRSSVSGSPAP